MIHLLLPDHQEWHISGQTREGLAWTVVVSAYPGEGGGVFMDWPDPEWSDLRLDPDVAEQMGVAIKAACSVLLTPI